MEISLKIVDSSGGVKAQSVGTTKAALFYDEEYTEGDSIVVEASEENRHLFIQLDDCMPSAFVYLRGKSYSFKIPLGEERKAYSPRAFAFGRHLLWARYATDEEIFSRKSIAENPLDRHQNNNLYPHASANIETRGEAIFAARNAIDGIVEGFDHGVWPFASWGINRDPLAEFKLDFGRIVCIDTAVVFLRSDFPHDAWWERITFEFSDGSVLTAPLEKTGDGQRITFPAKNVDWVILKELIKADDPSPFPALRQIQFWGNDI